MQYNDCFPRKNISFPTTAGVASIGSPKTFVASGSILSECFNTTVVPFRPTAYTRPAAPTGDAYTFSSSSTRCASTSALPVFTSKIDNTPLLSAKKYSRLSYSSGDGTYGVLFLCDHAIASVPVKSPVRPSLIASRLYPRNPLITYTTPSACTGIGIALGVIPPHSQIGCPLARS